MTERERDSYENVADLYDFVVPYQQRPDVPFFVAAATEQGGPVLEIGCGTGRVLVPTARAGIEIVGLDASQRMLALCRAHLSQEPDDVRRRVRLVEGDMRAFDLGQTFSLITLPFRPFQHLVTVEDQRACLACIRRHLAPGGRMVLDLFNPFLEMLANTPIGQEIGQELAFTMPDGRRVVRCHRYTAHDRFNQVNDVELIYDVTYPDGRQERLVHAFRMRYLFRFEVEHLLARCGFAIEQIYSGYDKSPFGSTYPGELIVIAKES